MLDRPAHTLAFLVILVVCLGGALHATWFVALAGACALALISLHTAWRRPMFARARAVSDPAQLIASTINAVVASGGAFVFGQLSTWIWMV